VPYPFTSQVTSKRRPAFVVSSHTYNFDSLPLPLHGAGVALEYFGTSV
jgi:hypothetical protein